MIKPTIISVVGKSNSGKTTLLEKIIPELKKRGYRLGIVKHTHQKFDMDQEGKDSWRHKQAGAAATLVISATAIALHKDEEIGYQDGCQKYLQNMDLIITEGFKKEELPRIEVFRKANLPRQPLFMEGLEIVAFVSDSDILPPGGITKFGLEEITSIANFIEKTYLDSPASLEKNLEKNLATNLATNLICETQTNQKSQD